jgi:hypothetical protein
MRTWSDANASVSDVPPGRPRAGQALELIGEFRRHHPEITVKAVLADALFGTQPFLDEASRQCGQA